MARLIQFELRKIFSRRLTQIFLLGLIFISILFMFSTYQNKYAFDGINREGTGREAVEIDKAIAKSSADRGRPKREGLWWRLFKWNAISTQNIFIKILYSLRCVPDFQILMAIGTG